MLDFFRDMMLETKGIDSNIAAKERKEKMNKKQKEYYIFSKSVKRIIYFLGILYLFTGSMNMIAIRGHNNIIFVVLKFLFLSIIDITALICLSIHKKKTEIFALILVIIFALVMYITTMF